MPQHLGELKCIVTYSNQELHFTGCFNVMTHYPLILTIIIIIIISGSQHLWEQTCIITYTTVIKNCIYIVYIFDIYFFQCISRKESHSSVQGSTSRNRVPVGDDSNKGLQWTASLQEEKETLPRTPSLRFYVSIMQVQKCTFDIKCKNVRLILRWDCIQQFANEFSSEKINVGWSIWILEICGWSIWILTYNCGLVHLNPKTLWVTCPLNVY